MDVLQLFTKNAPVPVTQPENQPETEIVSGNFDLDCAQKIFADTLDRLNNQCPFGAIDWAKLHRPELWEACQRALAQVEAAFKRQNMAAVRRAVEGYEQANLALFKAYPGSPWRPGQKGTGSRVWQLSDEQARELEDIFAAPGIVERVSRRGQLQRWYSPDAWEEYRKTLQTL